MPSRLEFGDANMEEISEVPLDTSTFNKAKFFMISMFQAIRKVVDVWPIAHYWGYQN